MDRSVDGPATRRRSQAHGKNVRLQNPVDTWNLPPAVTPPIRPMVRSIFINDRKVDDKTNFSNANTALFLVELQGKLSVPDELIKTN